MLDAGFHPDFPPEILRQVQAPKNLTPIIPNGKIQDLRGLLWSSIDNDTSRDLDQVEYAEALPDGTVRLLVGVADVDYVVPAGSAIDQHATSETVSVYTGVVTFPMLPIELSYDQTSLNPGQDRQALVMEMHIRPSGEVICHDLFGAQLRNHAQLTYNSVGAWLEGTGPIPPAVANVPGLDAQLRLQFETSKHLRDLRRTRGSLNFASLEPVPVLENGELAGLATFQHNAAEDIIESFMVAANVAMAEHLKKAGALSIRRVVKTPKRWDRIQAVASLYGVKLPASPDPRPLSDFLDQRRAADPMHFPDLSLSIIRLMGPGEYIVEHPGQEHEGHFGLAVQDYSHSTAPNRRFVDLVTQRLVKAAANDAPSPYAEGELGAIARHCTEREDAARTVERLMRKIMAASLLSHRIGEMFDGIITGATPKGTFVRLLKMPAEGMVVGGANGIDVGDKVRVRLTGVDINRGFIDFERK
jgi:exoribonuclease-2